MMIEQTEATKKRLGEDSRVVLKILHKLFAERPSGAWVQRGVFGKKPSGRFNTVVANMVGENLLKYMREPSTRCVSYQVTALGWQLLKEVDKVPALSLYETLGRTNTAHEHRAKLVGPPKTACRTCSGRLDKGQRRDAQTCRACLEGRGKGSKKIPVRLPAAFQPTPAQRAALVEIQARRAAVPTFTQLAGEVTVLAQQVFVLTTQLAELRKDVHGLRSKVGASVNITHQRNGHGLSTRSAIARIEGVLEQLRAEGDL